MIDDKLLVCKFIGKSSAVVQMARPNQKVKREVKIPQHPDALLKGCTQHVVTIRLFLQGEAKS